MHKLLKRLAVVTVIGMPVVAGLIVPTGSATAGTALHTILRVTPAGPAVTPPNSNIKGKSKHSHYAPKSITTTEDTSGDMCTATVTFTITNKTKATEYITEDSEGGFVPAVALPAGQVVDGCNYGGSAGSKVILGLSNSTDTVNYKARLTIHYTD